MLWYVLPKAFELLTFFLLHVQLNASDDFHHSYPILLTKLEYDFFFKFGTNLTAIVILKL